MNQTPIFTSSELHAAKEGIAIYFELATHFRLRGCAYDIGNAGSPATLSIRAEDGTVLPLERQAMASGPALQRKFGLPAEARLSFDINLFDMFNMNPGNVAILNEAGDVIWDMEGDLAAFQSLPDRELVLPNAGGSRRLILLTSDQSPLLPVLDKIMRWQPALLEKSNTSEIAVSAIGINDITDQKATLLKERNALMILDEGCFRAALGESPTLMHTVPFLLLRNGALRQDAWLGGIPQIVTQLANLPDGPPEVTLFRTITHLCSYAELFFPTSENMFVLHSGGDDPRAQIYVRDELQTQSKDAVVLLSDAPIHDLRQLNDERHTLVVNVRAMRHTMDIFGLEGYAFAKEVLRRGIKIRKVVLGKLT